jgi:hypothetical protein
VLVPDSHCVGLDRGVRSAHAIGDPDWIVQHQLIGAIPVSASCLVGRAWPLLGPRSRGFGWLQMIEPINDIRESLPFAESEVALRSYEIEMSMLPVLKVRSGSVAVCLKSR